MIPFALKRNVKRWKLLVSQCRSHSSGTCRKELRKIWTKKNAKNLNWHYNRFRAFAVKDWRIVSSTDGESDIVAPKTKGKKINQGKRKRTERTISLKKAKI